MGTGDEDCPEALLAGMDTTLADLVISAVAVLPEEEGPFQPPLLAPAHRSCSGGFFCWPCPGLALAALPFGLRQPLPDGRALLRVQGHGGELLEGWLELVLVLGLKSSRR